VDGDRLAGVVGREDVAEAAADGDGVIAEIRADVVEPDGGRPWDSALLVESPGFRYRRRRW
jgi:hypothetical protein